MPLEPAQKTVVDALVKLGQLRVRDTFLEALRDYVDRPSTEQPIEVNGQFGARLAARLIQEAGLQEPANMALARNMFLESQAELGMTPYRETLWSLISIGVITPGFIGVRGGGAGLSGSEAAVTSFTVTDRGRRALKHLWDHPLSPRFVRRLVERCPTLPDEVQAHLEDAQACATAGLLRPSVILLGLAYEVAVERVGEFLEKSKAYTPKPKLAAAARIDSIKAFLPQLSLGPEDLQRATAALDYADTLRQRRNDGSHPNARYPFNDPSEVDELLLSGGRYLPGLWFLTTT